MLFQMGQFYYAAKAFDALEKLDPGSSYWEGKRGACVGIFQLILANKESKYVFLTFLCSSLRHDFIIFHRLFSCCGVMQNKHNKWCIFDIILFPYTPCLGSREALKEVLALLRNSGNPQVEYIIRALRKWAKDNRVLLSWQGYTCAHWVTCMDCTSDICHSWKCV